MSDLKVKNDGWNQTQIVFLVFNPCSPHRVFQTVTKSQVILPTKGGWEKRDKSLPKKK